MLLKSVELGSNCLRAAPGKSISFEESSSSLAFELFSLFGTCRLNSKSCQLWLSPLEAQTQRSLNSPFSAAAAGGCLESVECSEPYNGTAALECCYTTPRGLGPRDILNREANHGFITSLPDKKLQMGKCPGAA